MKKPTERKHRGAPGHAPGLLWGGAEAGGLLAGGATSEAPGASWLPLLCISLSGTKVLPDVWDYSTKGGPPNISFLCLSLPLRTLTWSWEVR